MSGNETDALDQTAVSDARPRALFEVNEPFYVHIYKMFYVHADCGAFVWVVRQYLLHNEAHVFEYTCTGRAKSINTLIPKHCTQVPAILLSPVASFRVQNVKCPLYNYYETRGPAKGPDARIRCGQHPKLY